MATPRRAFASPVHPVRSPRLQTGLDPRPEKKRSVASADPDRRSCMRRWAEAAGGRAEECCGAARSSEAECVGDTNERHGNGGRIPWGKSVPNWENSTGENGLLG